MRKQNTSSVKAHLVRGAFYVLLLIFFFLIRFALAQQNIVKPAGVVGAHLVSVPPALSPQKVIYGRYNNETEIPLSPGPSPTSTATATATATHTPTPCGQYWTTSGNLPIVPGTTDTGNHCDDCDTVVSLPFPFRLYGVTYSSVMVSSNGRLDFVCDHEPAPWGSCLPAAGNCSYAYTIFPLWTALVTDSIHGAGCSTWANGCGIFTSISGTAPNRIFNIEWHALLSFTSNTPQDFEVRLHENDPNQRFDLIYGTVGNIFGLNYLWVGGVQGPPGFFTEDFCQTSVSPPRANVSRTYTFVPCVSPTPTSTPTATPTCIPIAIYGSINNGDPTQVNRVFRSGTASSCGGPLRPCSIVTAGAIHYNAYSFTNTTGSTQCVTVNLNTSCVGTNNIFTVAYLGSFDPNNVCTNYLADEGQSPNPENQFSFNLDNGQAVVLVVSEVTSGAGCPSYVMTVSGVCVAGPTPTPTPTPSATATPSGSPPCTVTSPACGIDVQSQVTDFIVNASGPVDPATLQPSDFTCNGIPANAATLSNNNSTITFHFTASPVLQGQNTMHIPQGAFTCDNHEAVVEFTCPFSYQASTPTPTARPIPVPRPRPTPAPRQSP